MRSLFRRAPRPLPIDPLFGALIGDLDGSIGRISPAGSVMMADRSWSLEWGIRDAERWRRASAERAVRQNRLDDTPVYETRMRVAGGDVIQRVGVLNDGNGRALLVEYENDSPDALVVATVGRIAEPLTATAAGVARPAGPWMRPERPAGAVLMGRDIWAAVEAEAAGTNRSGDGDVAVLLALPHRQTISIVVGFDGDLPTQVSTAGEIAAGWRTITARGLDIEVSDVALTAAWRRLVCDLILVAGDDDPVVAGEAAWWLDLAGLHREADRGRAQVLAASDHGLLGPVGAVAALRSFASACWRDNDADSQAELAELAGPLARLSGPQLDQATLRMVARALAVTAPAAAADARRLVERVSRPTYTTQSPVAQGAERVLAMLLVDLGDEATIGILPSVPKSWNGQPLDVRGLVTSLGSLSFSVRWHGERPALLWERTGGPDLVELRCPAWDSAWSSTERNGEALLSCP